VIGKVLTSVAATVSLREVKCPKCMGVFAISSEYIDEANRRGKFEMCWRCPYCGESRGYGESEADRLRREINEQRLKTQQENFRAEREASRAQANLEAFVKERKEKERLKKRIGAGVCACCGRTFRNVARHMRTKHPELAVGRHVLPDALADKMKGDQA
jgi:hypothetical protein